MILADINKAKDFVKSLFLVKFTPSNSKQNIHYIQRILHCTMYMLCPMYYVHHMSYVQFAMAYVQCTLYALCPMYNL